MEEFEKRFSEIFDAVDVLNIMVKNSVDEDCIRAVAFELFKLIDKKIKTFDLLRSTIYFEYSDVEKITKNVSTTYNIDENSVSRVQQYIIHSILKFYNGYLKDVDLKIVLNRDALNKDIDTSVLINEEKGKTLEKKSKPVVDDNNLIMSRLEESINFFDELDDSLNGRDIKLVQNKVNEQKEKYKDLGVVIANSRINDVTNRVVYDATEQMNLKEILNDKKIIIEKVVENAEKIKEKEDRENNSFIKSAINESKLEDLSGESIEHEQRPKDFTLKEYKIQQINDQMPKLETTLYDEYTEKDSSKFIRIIIFVVIIALICFIIFGVLKLKNKGVLYYDNINIIEDYVQVYFKYLL